MKKFLIKIAIFAVVLYGLAWGLDYAISKGLYQMDDYRFMSWHEMEQGDINADVLIMGNSRGFSHFEPWTIDSITGMSCYCLGIGGYPINVETMKYHYYRLYNKKPKLIIQQVDYYTINDLKALHQHESEQFLPLIYDRRIQPEMQRVGYSWLDMHCPLYRYWGYQMIIKNGLSEFLGIKHYTKDPSRMGHHYECGEWDGTVLAQMDTIYVNAAGRDKTCFERYMQECSDEGIKVLLINSPTYVGANMKTVGLDSINAYFDSIAAAYHTEYWNYSEEYELCSDTSNFVVSIHMNPLGTHRFSVDVANRIKDEKIIQQ